ncbi:rod shape-determining protein MreD [Caenispirillum bisanense]|nr:rod shape-determining protein MreD [Caenispirillum bisanense]
MARHLVPFVLTLMLILLAATPTHLPGMVRVGPMLSLIGVYYWAVYRPDLMGYGSAFSLGLFEDILTGAPLGSGALMLLITTSIVVSQYKFFNGKSFAVTWWAFALVGLIAAGTKWLAVSLIYGLSADLQTVAVEYLLTLALYPVLGWLLARAQLYLIKDA